MKASVTSFWCQYRLCKRSVSEALLSMLTAAVVQFWKEVVEDTEVRELIWDKSNAAQGKRI